MMIYYSSLPRLRDSIHQITSRPLSGENCIAHAIGARSEWWEPIIGRYWPVGALYYNEKIDSLVYVFARIGFTRCDEDVPLEVSAKYEPGYEKVAIYGKDGIFTHAARQLADNGMWTSKLGPDDDISHANLECLTDAEDGTGEYGQVVCIMKRPIPQSGGLKCCEDP